MNRAHARRGLRVILTPANTNELDVAEVANATSAASGPNVSRARVEALVRLL